MSFSLESVFHDIQNIQASRYTCGAGMVVMFYDYFLTLPDEIEYVWSGHQRISFVKAMFLFNRYFTVPWIVLSNYHLSGLRGPLSKTLLVILHSTLCKVQIVSVAVVQGVSIAVSIQLLALRVLALYKNNTKIRISLYAFLAACHIALWTMVGISMHRFVPYLMFLPLTNTCYTIPDPIISKVYIPPILAETAILVLQIANHIQRRKHYMTLKTPLLSTLFRDGYLYFFAIMSVRLIALFIYNVGPGSFWFVANQLDFPLTVALVSRFFLQLRAAAYDDENETLAAPRSSQGRGISTISMKRSQGASIITGTMPVLEDDFIPLDEVQPTLRPTVREFILANTPTRHGQ